MPWLETVPGMLFKDPSYRGDTAGFELRDAVSLKPSRGDRLRASFVASGEAPNLASYAAVEPTLPLDERNVKASSLTGPARNAALASARMNFVQPDAAPSEQLNRILWHTAKGWSTPYPSAKRSLFFPMAVDLSEARKDADDDDGDPRPAKPRAAKPPW